MTNIEETSGAGPSLLPQQIQETKSGGTAEKVGREALIHTATTTPSVEQAQVASATFESYLFNEVGSKRAFPIQFVEAARLGILLEKGLVEFEKGVAFRFISKSGEPMTIQAGEKSTFAQNFLTLLSSLLEKSQTSTQLKTMFYSLASRFVKSSSFLGSNPNWGSTLEQEKKAFSRLPKEEGSQKQIEQGFLENPSTQTLARLLIQGKPGE